MNINWIDQNTFFVLVGLILALVGLVVLFWGLRTWSKGGTQESRRISDFISLDEDNQKSLNIKKIIPREIKGSLINRTLISWGQRFFGFIGRLTPEKRVNAINHRLGIAGYPMNMRSREFLTLQFFFIVVGALIGIYVIRDLQELTLVRFLLGILIFLFFLILPTIWLNSRVRRRQDEIRRGLPDALDMLSVCASAGLAFDQSLQKISSYWRTELGFEITRVTHEMEMGVSRSVALTNMSERLDVDELSRFIAIIIQAEKMGMSYADVLHSQATQLRVLRQYRAREISNKLPAKMIIPLAILIFPALIIVILAPVLPTLLNLF